MRSFRPLLRPAAPTVFPFRFTGIGLLGKKKWHQLRDGLSR
jgi:hypothetical protein